MTRAMCSRRSKRTHTKSCQDVITDNCKENSPHITSQLKNNKKQVKEFSNVASSKENSILGNNLQNSVLSQNNEGITRKSARHRKSSFNNKDFMYNVPKGEIKTGTTVKRNVLSDKTNSPFTRVSKTNKQQLEPPETILNKNNLTNTVNVSQENDSADKSNSKPHVPVYKTINSSDNATVSSNLPPAKKEAVYEFDEVDENEEPVKKRKKKRTNVRKPKTGPKALTINNIKYSSSESLVSLPENKVKKKKIKTKIVAPHIKPHTSVNILNDSEDTNYSVQSFMSHPPSLRLCDKRELKNKRDLSVLQETQSEECQSPIHQISTSDPVDPVTDQSEIMVNPQNSDPLKISTPLHNDSRLSRDNSAVSQQRCYPSKKSFSNSNMGSHGISYRGSSNDTAPIQFSPCSANISTASMRDFLSSTPCKRTSLVVCQNSVFDESLERDIPLRIRPSTGFIKDSSENVAIEDKCFGFDEPEELEEPLVSPIKNINLQERRKPPWRHHELSLSHETENSKPNLKDVIEMLKSTLPKAQTKECSQVFSGSDSSSSDHSNISSPISKEVETTLSFVKPPRRSYERQRRIRHYSEHEEDEEEEYGDSEEKERKHEKQEQDNIKPTKKCYQKKNTSKVFKAPKVPKAKQRILKEEEELERLAAQMNAQFQKIEKCNLIVE